MVEPVRLSPCCPLRYTLPNMSMIGAVILSLYFCFTLTTRLFLYQLHSLQVIDLVLDASPTNSTSQQQIEFQTDVLTTLMENLLNTELFGTESYISNVCYVAARLVDKLWQGQLSKDPHDVRLFDWILCNVISANY